MKRITAEKETIDTILTRGVAAVYPSKEFVEAKLKSGKKMTIYLGVDPTGPLLHLGHAIPMMKLRQLQQAGHKVVLLIGDFTAMSGDPDKTEVRKRLTRKDILKNCKSYKQQASKILKFTGVNAVEYRFNSSWLGKLKFTDVVELASHVTVQRMLERDLFERRIKSGTPLYVHEFLYPLMQGYDSVAMDVDGEVGGNDQTFNMLTGRDLMKDYNGKEKFVITLKLLEDPTGKKMGKTEGNMVTLVDSPQEMFGKIMSWPDGTIVPALELLTEMPMSEIQKRENDMRSGKLNPRDAKAELARLVVTMYHDAKKAKQAEDEFIRQFKKKEIPTDIPEFKVGRLTLRPGELLVRFRLCESKSEARRMIEQGAVRINGEPLARNPDILVTVKKDDVIQVGKRKFVRIK